MRRIAYRFIWIILAAVLLLVVGCGIHGQGETAAEGKIRHRRILRTAAQQMADDVDAVLLYDEPSKLSELRTR